MTTTFNLTVGQTIQLALVLRDASGATVADAPGVLSTPASYSVDNPAQASLVPGVDSVAVTALAVGSVKVTASAVNSAGTTLSAESDGTIAAAVPLAVSMELVPGAISG